VADERSPVEIELETLIRARYPIIYIVSWEEKRVEETLRDICQRRGKNLIQWTFTTGMAGNVASRDPLQALEYVLNAPDQSVFLLKDFHPFINDVAVTRRLRDLIHLLQSSFKHIVVLSPILKLPPELEKEITVVDYKLPTPAELDRLLEGVIQAVRGDTRLKTDLGPQEREQVLQAASGLTSIEAANVFAKSLVETKGFDVDVILGEKEQIIRKSGILEYFRASEAFADVGGLDLLKDWLRQRTVSFSKEAREYGLPEPRGLMLLGVQGSGKSLTAKAIASQWKLPLLRLDIGKVFSGIVGSSEENMRRAIATAESVAPCVAGDTRITLADGSERAIEDLYQNPPETLEVLGMGDDWRLSPVGVRAVTRRPAPDLFTVRLRHGRLEATSNHLHPVLRDGRLTWVRTDALREGDSVAVPARMPQGTGTLKTVHFLPAETRLYSPVAWDHLAEDARTPQRRYQATRRTDYVKVSELVSREVRPNFDTVTRFVLGRGGTTDSELRVMPEILSNEVGYLLGLIDSDGYVSSRNRIGLVNTDQSLHQRFSGILRTTFGLETSTRSANAGETPALSGLGTNSVFKPCFLTYADNKLAAEVLRSIRDALLTLPLDFLRAYVRGYFDGDGCVSNPANAEPKITITAKRSAENRFIRTVLNRVGFTAPNVGNFNIEITGHRNVRRFAAEIGSDHPERGKRLREWLNQPEPAQLKDRCDLIPVGSLLRAARQAVGLMSNGFRAASSSLVHRYETGEGHPNRARLRALIAEMEATWGNPKLLPEPVAELKALAEGDVLWSPVLSVARAETPEFVYDLVCDEPHNFVANGIVTHNCILWIDELEKGLSGTQSSGSTDGGTTSRVFSTFLTWLSEKKAPVFVVATSNDVTQLPPELLRKGRFDEIFFVDLPARDERKEIFAIHLKKRKRDPAKFDVDKLADESAGYSGAEIEQAVIGSLFSAFNDGARELTTDDLINTIQESVPLSITMREGIQRLREWAETRARQASSQQSESTEELAELDSARRFDEIESRHQPAPSPASAPALTPDMMALLAGMSGMSQYAMSDGDDDADDTEEVEEMEGEGAPPPPDSDADTTDAPAPEKPARARRKKAE
jgi:ATP-dependent 26S proteasome regulatory subunit/intein/homing endonuclease